MRAKQVVSSVLAAAVAAGCLMVGAARPAQARGSEDLWRIGTYVGGAATGAALAKGRGTWALVGAGATALSYSQWKRQVRNRHRRERAYSYGSPGYRSYRSYRSYDNSGYYGGSPVYSRTAGYRSSRRFYGSRSYRSRSYGSRRYYGRSYSRGRRYHRRHRCYCR
jgi:hypothetical protein